jgi:DNA-binding transcriptional ArsR family regulator
LDKSTIDLIIHPVRLRIMGLLGRCKLTTQQISDALPDTPRSSIYRHLRLLLEGGLIDVAETRLVNGIEEKVYVLKVAPRITDPADMAGLSHEEHLRYFTVFLTELLHGYAEYLDATPVVDMGADRVGFTAAAVYATAEEWDTVGTALNKACWPWLPIRPARDAPCARSPSSATRSRTCPATAGLSLDFAPPGLEGPAARFNDSAVARVCAVPPPACEGTTHENPDSADPGPVPAADGPAPGRHERPGRRRDRARAVHR